MNFLGLMKEMKRLREAGQVFIRDVVPDLDLSQYEDLAEDETASLPNWVVYGGKKIPVVYDKVNNVISLS